MCLYTRQKRAKIAKKDIPCYKLFKIKNTHILSIYQEYRYYINRLEFIPKFGIFQRNGDKIINDGLHAFLSIDTTKRYRVAGGPGRGARVLYPYEWIIYNAIIPKGSKYYIGVDGDIVSNQIMITGRYKDKD